MNIKFSMVQTPEVCALSNAIQNDICMVYIASEKSKNNINAFLDMLPIEEDDIKNELKIHLKRLQDIIIRKPNEVKLKVCGKEYDSSLSLYSDYNKREFTKLIRKIEKTSPNSRTLIENILLYAMSEAHIGDTHIYTFINDNAPFVRQYFTEGNISTDIQLSEFGEKYVKNLENSPDVNRVIDSYISDKIEQAKITPSGFHDFDNTGEIDVIKTTCDPSLFSIGGIILYRDTVCADGICNFTFSINDIFQDPLDIGIEMPFSNRYRILHKWKISKKY
jgi:hypothetical protein